MLISMSLDRSHWFITLHMARPPVVAAPHMLLFSNDIASCKDRAHRDSHASRESSLGPRHCELPAGKLHM